MKKKTAIPPATPASANPEDYRMQREDQGAPDVLDTQAKGTFGTARKAVKRLPKKPSSQR
jgi:hypothetical protein